MGRIEKVADRVRLDVWLLRSQNERLEEFCRITGITKTDAVGEALQYWLAEQKRMGVTGDAK